MPFWEQLALYQGLAALHTVIAKYTAKYYTPEETAILQQAADLMGSLPQRLHEGTPPKPAA